MPVREIPASVTLISWHRTLVRVAFPFLARDAFVRTKRRAIAVMFVRRLTQRMTLSDLE